MSSERTRPPSTGEERREGEEVSGSVLFCELDTCSVIQEERPQLRNCFLSWSLGMSCSIFLTHVGGPRPGWDVPSLGRWAWGV